MGLDAKPVVVTEKTIGLYRARSEIKEWNAVECFELSLSIARRGGSFLSKAKNQKTTRNELKKILITGG